MATSQLRAIATGVVLTVLLVAAPQASADHPFVSAFSGPGSGDGEVSSPGRVAVEQSTGNLFVVDSGNDRVQVFAPTEGGAAYLTQFGAGVLDAPRGIAIDSFGGQTVVYVSDAGNGRIVKLQSDEAAIPTFTVDATYSSPALGSGEDEVADFAAALALAPNGDLLVADPGSDVVKRFDPSGAHVVDGNLDGSTSPGGAFTGLLDVATTPAGDVYVVDENGDVANSIGTSRVERFAADGSHLATLAPVGPNQRPATVAVDPQTGNVAVSGEQDAVYRDQTPTLHFFDATNASTEELVLNGAAFQDLVTGVAFHGPSGRLYVAADSGRYFGTPYGQPTLLAYQRLTPPSVAIDPVDPATISPTSATFTGTVEPNGKPAQWRFEYRRVGTTAWTPTQGGSAGDGTAPVAVEETVSGLASLSDYEVRLVGVNAEGTGSSPAVSFSTPAGPPSLTEAVATQISPTSARLRARLRANNQPTTYYFEYGIDTSYGSAVPADRSGSLGSSGEFVPVSHVVHGLTPGATYHFRVVATNASGTTFGDDQSFVMRPTSACPNAAVRQQQAAGFLPNCRAYEQASPPDKSGAAIYDLVNTRQVSASGDAVVFTSATAMADPPGSPLTVTSMARRDPSGWTTRSLTPPDDPGGPGGVISNAGQYSTFTADLRYGILNADRPALVPGAPDGVRNLYRRDTASTAYDLVTLAGPVGDPFYQPAVADASADLSHVLFEAPAALTPDAPAGVTNLYEWTPGELRFVGVLPDGSAAAGGSISGSVAAQPQPAGWPGKAATISADGSRIYFSDLATGELYLREHGTTTKEVSGSPGAQFQAATPDGSQAFFLSSEELTDDANTGDGSGRDLYRYDAASGDLTDLSVDTNPADPSGAQVQGVLAVSDDGAYVYFVAHGQIEPGEGMAGQANLYSWHAGEVDYLATLAADDIDQPFDSNYWTAGLKPLNDAATPDGRHLILTSEAALTDVPTGGQRQVYVYDADADEWTCVSCPADGTTPTAYSETTVYQGNPGYQRPAVNISDDGERAYFHTPQALVPEDGNGQVDVYQYEDGAARLLSNGRGDYPAYYFGTTASGDDVFFATRNPLVAADRDEFIDVYDVRVGGGFPEPPPAVPCQSDNCQGPLTEPPRQPDLGSRAVLGDQPASGPRPRASLARVGARIRSQLARRGRAAVRVRVSRAGRVSLVARARIGRRSVVVARSSRSVRRAGVVRLTLRLSRPARRALDRRGALSLSLSARLAGQPSPATARVRLTEPASTDRKGR